MLPLQVTEQSLKPFTEEPCGPPLPYPPQDSQGTCISKAENCLHNTPLLQVFLYCMSKTSHVQPTIRPLACEPVGWLFFGDFFKAGSFESSSPCITATVNKWFSLLH